MDEEQFILRLPPALAEKMRFSLGSKAKEKAAKRGEAVPNFSIRWVSDREAFFTSDGIDYPATLMDLPNVAETHKTADKKTFFKSADVHQVLVVRTLDAPTPSSTLLRDGLTPAAKSAGTRFAPMKPIFSAEQVSNVENQLKIVLDKKIAFVQKAEEVAPEPTEELEIVEMEPDTHAGGATTSPAVPTPSKESVTPSVSSMPSMPSMPTQAKKEPHKKDIKRKVPLVEKAPVPGSLPVKPTEGTPPTEKTTDARTEATTADAIPAQTKMPSTEQDLSPGSELSSLPTSQPAATAPKKPPVLAPPPLAPRPSSLTSTKPPSETPEPTKPSPEASPSPGDNAMAEAQRQMEVIRLEKLYADQEKVVKDLEEQLEHQSNPIMKRRLQSKLDDAKALLSDRQKTLHSFQPSS